MYLVGHALVAVLIALGISKKFGITRISFALVMLIACLPDVDILFEAAGLTSHKTFTHSLILSTIVVPAVIFALARWRKVSLGAALVYSLAYIQHIAIGDIVVGATNILYPFGELMVGTGIGYGTVEHQTIEFLLLAIAAGIVLGKAFGRQLKEATLFRFNVTDKVAYALFVAALVISFSYLLYGVKILPRLFIKTDLELALFVMLHLSTLALLSFLVLVCRQHTILHSHRTAISYKE
jgi:hypothetical protein